MTVKKLSHISTRLRTGVSITPLVDIANAVLVAFNRLLINAQPDEKMRYDAVAKVEIDPYYTKAAIDAARISSQFLNAGEAITVPNRDLLIRLGYDEGENVEIVSDDGTYLGFIGGLQNSELLLSPTIVNGKRAFIMTFPDYAEVDIYLFNPEEGRYLYSNTAPMKRLAA